MDYEIRTPEERKLRDWMTANAVFPSNLDMQSLIINSYHSANEEEYADEDLIPLDEVDLETAGISEGLDYRAVEKTDEEEDQAFDERVKYALNDLNKFLAYINAEWRFEEEE